MHRRVRHLNKSLRDAACVFDSRFLTGFSDGNAVGTWIDLSANSRNATQATPGNQPIYKTGIQGGNPVVRFDGSNDLLETSAFASTANITAIQVIKANSWTSPSEYKQSGGHGYGAPDITTTGIDFFTLAQSSFNYWQTSDLIAFGNGYSNTNPKAAGPSASGSDFRIISTILSTSLARIYANGLRLSTRAETADSAGLFTRAFSIGGPITGSIPGERWLGDIAVVIYFPTNIGEAMRARIERSNAFAFKIACS
jgi:hypothetical protein